MPLSKNIKKNILTKIKQLLLSIFIIIITYKLFYLINQSSNHIIIQKKSGCFWETKNIIDKNINKFKNKISIYAKAKK